MHMLNHVHVVNVSLSICCFMQNRTVSLIYWPSKILTQVSKKAINYCCCWSVANRRPFNCALLLYARPTRDCYNESRKSWREVDGVVDIIQLWVRGNRLHTEGNWRVFSRWATVVPCGGKCYDWPPIRGSEFRQLTQMSSVPPKLISSDHKFYNASTGLEWTAVICNVIPRL
jgi:hypothetical protein